MKVMRYAIRCTPGGLLRDESTHDILYFDSYAEAESEAQRLSQVAYSNPRLTGVDFTPVEAEDEGEASSALEFSNVTIKNPFGDGDIEVEEISLSDLPGFAPAASNDAAAGTGDQYSQTVKKFKTGDWLEFRESDEHRLQAKLSYISPLKGTYLFVNRHGERVGEYSLFQLAQEMRAGRAVVLEDVPLIDRAMSSLVGALKKNSR